MPENHFPLKVGERIPTSSVKNPPLQLSVPKERSDKFELEVLKPTWSNYFMEVLKEEGVEGYYEYTIWAQSPSALHCIGVYHERNIMAHENKKPLKIKGFTPPYRLGKKQSRAILDATGHLVVLFEVGMEKTAKDVCGLMNLGK